jgi:NAD(P)H-dependent FMN reductase
MLGPSPRRRERFRLIRGINARDAFDPAARLDSGRTARHCAPMPLLQVITVSTRPSRVGPKIADWFLAIARRFGGFEVEPVDLATVGLPLLDEPFHPRARRYQHEHTQAWSATIARADAFVFVMPEYNHMPAPSLINALDYLVVEWAYKPAGLVSYGGVAAGLRAAQALKPMLAGLKIVPMVESVAIPFFDRYLSKEHGTFVPEPLLADAAVAMLAELHRWAGALRVLRD